MPPKIKKVVRKGSKGVVGASKVGVGVGKIMQESDNKKTAAAGKKVVAVSRTTRQAGRIGRNASQGKATTKTTVNRSANLAKKSAARFA